MCTLLGYDQMADAWEVYSMHENIRLDKSAWAVYIKCMWL